MSCLPSMSRVPEGYGLLDPLPRTAPPMTAFKTRRLSRMARSGNVTDRISAAGNPNTPFEALRRLTHDPDAKVRSWVLRNPQVPLILVQFLACDTDQSVRAYAKLLLEAQ